MSNSVTDTRDLINTIRGLEQRVRDLERSNRAVGAVPRGESIQVYEADGSRIAAIGQHPTRGTVGLVVEDQEEKILFATGVNTAQGLYGTRIYHPTPPGDPEYSPLKAVLKVDYGGLVLPISTFPLAAGQNFTSQPYNVTSGSFTQVMLGTVLRCPADSVSTWVRVSTPVGTTGEVRVTHNNGAGAQTSAVAVNSNNLVVTINFNWLHGATLYDDVTFQVEARRTGGAGNVSVYESTTGLAFMGNEIYGATASGV